MSILELNSSFTTSDRVINPNNKHSLLPGFRELGNYPVIYLQPIRLLLAQRKRIGIICASYAAPGIISLTIAALQTAHAQHSFEPHELRSFRWSSDLQPTSTRETRQAPDIQQTAKRWRSPCRQSSSNCSCKQPTIQDKELSAVNSSHMQTFAVRPRHQLQIVVDLTHLVTATVSKYMHAIQSSENSLPM